VSIATLLPERLGRVPGSPSYGTSPLDSALTDIVRKVFVGPDGSGCQAVALLYSRPDLGSSLLCASLANILGDLHGKVLVISARDLLNTVAARPGVSDIDFFKIGDSSIWIAPQVPKAPRATVRALDLDRAMTTLKSQFDFLIIDAGSFSDLSKSAALARHIDGFLVLIKEGQAVVRDLISVRQRIEKDGGRIIGSVYSGYGMATVGER